MAREGGEVSTRSSLNYRRRHTGDLERCGLHLYHDVNTGAYYLDLTDGEDAVSLLVTERMAHFLHQLIGEDGC